MTLTHARRAIATTLIALVAGCAAHAAAGTAPTPAPLARVGKDSSVELAAIAQARQDSLRYPYTAADIQFMSGMSGHHAQAIVMSRWAPTHGASESVRTLAARIINSQQDEILTMQTWLRDRRQPVPDPNAGPMKMMMDGREQEMLMPGMLTETQMQQLDAARGRDFDRLFLTDMIQHHRGALTMIHQLVESYGAAQDQLVFKLASDINVDQTTEIARMQRMLFAITIGAAQ